jgi:hypothetical protein
VPELAEAAQQTTDGVMAPRWDEITIGALASQMAGIARDGEISLSSPLCENVELELANNGNRWTE